MNSILSLPLPLLCITSCRPFHARFAACMSSEWALEFFAALCLSLPPSFNLLSHHPWGRLGAEFCHCFDTALSLLMNKWPLSMIEHTEQRGGRKGHFQNSLHVVNILNEFALWKTAAMMIWPTMGVDAFLYNGDWRIRPRFKDPTSILRCKKCCFWKDSLTAMLEDADAPRVSGSISSLDTLLSLSDVWII